jgi:O-antigen/teichoic acid export membrane protein
MIRRLVTAVGIYAAAALGFAATVVAARTFPSAAVMGAYTTVIATTGLFQTLLDLTVEEAAVKYGFRYETQQAWGKLRRLLGRALVLKLVGGALAAAVLLALAPFAGSLFNYSGIGVPLAVGAAIPFAQAPEGLAGVVLFLRGRYDVRAVFLALSMALRLAAVAVGAPHGLTTTLVLIVVAQLVATSAIGAAAWVAFRGFPRVPSEPLGDDRRDIVRFFVQSSAGTGVVSLRTALVVPLLTAVTSTVQAALFKIAQAPQTGMATLSAPLRMILVTEQTRDWERGSHEAVLRGVRRYSLGALALMVVVVPVGWWLMPDLVRWIFGARYLGGVDAARLILVASAVLFLVGWSKSLPIAVGRPNLRIWTHGIETLVLLPLVGILGWRWGATGAAAAVLVASGVFAAAWAVLFARISRDASVQVVRDDVPLAPLEPPAEALVP